MRSWLSASMFLATAIGSCGMAILAAGTNPVEAQSAFLGKTVDTTFKICATTAGGGCTKSQRVHIYVGESGHIYSFNGTDSGGSFTPGQATDNGNSAAVYRMEGDKLIFEAVARNGAQNMALRLGIAVRGNRCVFTDFMVGYNNAGLPAKVQYGACRVYLGRKGF